MWLQADGSNASAEKIRPRQLGRSAGGIATISSVSHSSEVLRGQGGISAYPPHVRLKTNIFFLKRVR